MFGLEAVKSFNISLRHLESGIPGLAARLDVHVYVATCEVSGTRDPARAHSINMSGGRAASQCPPRRASEVEPALGARAAPEARL